MLVYPVTDAAGNFADAKENARFPSRAENAEGYFLTRAVMQWFCGHYLANAADGADWRVSPLRAKSLAGLAPAVVTTAWFDPLRDEGKAYADALIAAGVATKYHHGAGPDSRLFRPRRSLRDRQKPRRNARAPISGRCWKRAREMSDHMKEVPPAAVLLGREVISVDAKSGEVQLRFLADRQFANRHGTVQGGMLAAMLDSATGNAVMASLPRDRTAVTTRLDTTFVKPAALGPLTANARLVMQDERSALAEAELLDSSGQIVARARAELRVRERR